MKKIGLNLVSFELMERKGGPSTYLFNLAAGLKNAGIDDIRVESLIKHNKSSIEQNKKIKLHLNMKERVKKFLINYFPDTFAIITILSLEKSANAIGTSFKAFIENIESSVEVSFLHFHSVFDLFGMEKFFHCSVPKILTSHSPEAYHIEYVEYFMNEIKRYGAKISNEKK